MSVNAPRGPRTVPAVQVVKVGGRELRPGKDLETIVSWLAGSAARGRALVVVHGGGEEVSSLASRLGIPSEMVGGQRVTTSEVLPLVEGVLAGPVNLRLVSALSRAGVRALGLCGVSADVVVARDVRRGQLGLVGEPASVDATFLTSLLRSGVVPVFAPLASDGRGGVLNVNADLFAAGIAQALRGDLLLFTDVPGVLDTHGERLANLTPSQTRALLADGTIHGGMVPKVEAALHVLEQGASGVWIGPLPLSSPDPGSGAIEGGTWFLPEASVPSGPEAVSLPLLPSPLGAGAG